MGIANTFFEKHNSKSYYYKFAKSVEDIISKSYRIEPNMVDEESYRRFIMCIQN